ncbi:MAG: hypothetical protein ABIZ80_10960 [Bryobacteraceae bacterium]
MIATAFDSGFALGHDTYNGMAAASDGAIYYVLCAESCEAGGQMYRYDPASGRLDHVGDLTHACGETGCVSQSKSHVNFVEADGKLWFATHTGFYQIIDGMEKMGVPLKGRRPYPGGHLLSYDLATRQFEDYGIPVPGEGILTMNMDSGRGRIYGITWPSGRVFRYEIISRSTKDLGTYFEGGENGVGRDYRTICRSLAVDPRDGSVYFTRGEGTIFAYRYAADAVEQLDGAPMRKDYFGVYDAASPGHMAYNWRQVVWVDSEQAFYGVHGNSGYLFRFDPRTGGIDVLERLTSEPSKRSGMFDQFSYGYLGFTLGPDGETLYYLTGGAIFVDGKRVAGKESTAKGESKGEENLHLVTYRIPAGSYRDHGPIFFENGDRPAYVNSIAVSDNRVYTLSRVPANAVRTDLVSMRLL